MPPLAVSVVLTVASEETESNTFGKVAVFAPGQRVSAMYIPEEKQYDAVVVSVNADRHSAVVEYIGYVLVVAVAVVVVVVVVLVLVVVEVNVVVVAVIVAVVNMHTHTFTHTHTHTHTYIHTYTHTYIHTHKHAHTYTHTHTHTTHKHPHHRSKAHSITHSPHSLLSIRRYDERAELPLHLLDPIAPQRDVGDVGGVAVGGGGGAAGGGVGAKSSSGGDGHEHQSSKRAAASDTRHLDDSNLPPFWVVRTVGGREK